MIVGTLSGDKKIYKLTREELKNKSAQEFKDGDTVICGKYYIAITYGNYNTPGLCTTVSTREDIRNLSIHKQPYYIQEFIHRRIEDLITR